MLLYSNFDSSQSKSKVCCSILTDRESHPLNVSNFDSGQSKSKVCCSILTDRECHPLNVSMDTSCTLYFKRDSVLQQHLSRLPVTVSTLKRRIDREMNRYIKKVNDKKWRNKQANK